MVKSVMHDKEGSNEEKMINCVQCRREVEEVLGCVVSNGFGSVTLNNLYAGEIKEVGAKVTLGQKNNCFYLD